MSLRLMVSILVESARPLTVLSCIGDGINRKLLEIGCCGGVGERDAAFLLPLSVWPSWRSGRARRVGGGLMEVLNEESTVVLEAGLCFFAGLLVVDTLIISQSESGSLGETCRLLLLTWSIPWGQDRVFLGLNDLSQDRPYSASTTYLPRLTIDPGYTLCIRVGSSTNHLRYSFKST